MRCVCDLCCAWMRCVCGLTTEQMCVTWLFCAWMRCVCDLFCAWMICVCDLFCAWMRCVCDLCVCVCVYLSSTQCCSLSGEQAFSALRDHLNVTMQLVYKGHTWQCNVCLCVCVPDTVCVCVCVWVWGG